MLNRFNRRQRKEFTQTDYGSYETAGLRRDRNLVSKIFSLPLTVFKKIKRFLRHVGAADYARSALTGVKTNFSRLALGALILVAVVYIARSLFFFASDGSVGGADDRNLDLRPPVDSTQIDKSFTFPLSDGNGEVVGEIEYKIESAEALKEIVVQGQKATAVRGRVFLIINLKITNDYSQSIEIDTKDYVRLSRNGNRADWLAPDIHNDPVQIQAISTKLTRIGFPLDDSDEDLVLRVGEINGEKEEFRLDIKLK